MIYLDNAGTTKVSENAKNAMLPYFDEMYGNASSWHTIGQRAKKELEKARKLVAETIGTEPREIYFTSGGSESDNWTIENACALGERKGKKHIITSQIEHKDKFQPKPTCCHI